MRARRCFGSLPSVLCLLSGKGLVDARSGERAGELQHGRSRIAHGLVLMRLGQTSPDEFEPLLKLFASAYLLLLAVIKISSILETPDLAKQLLEPSGFGCELILGHRCAALLLVDGSRVVVI